jgi:hypothetical protein
MRAYESRTNRDGIMIIYSKTVKVTRPREMSQGTRGMSHNSLKSTSLLGHQAEPRFPIFLTFRVVVTLLRLAL